MTVYLAWTPAPVPDDLSGPWTEVRRAAPGLLLVDSGDTLSRVYHELKWSLPDDSPLLVTPLAERPKLKGLADGTQAWLGDRLPKG
ncbi:hypothetical protein [Nocardioides koreensis]|uniref:hypothetical protein n=1 Tax=Nocardioides koreensis TaxID=433651 RepID=UPI0031DC6997